MGIFSSDEPFSDENFKKKTLEDKYEDLKRKCAKLQQNLDESEAKYNRLINKLKQNKYYIKLRLQGKI